MFFTVDFADLFPESSATVLYWPFLLLNLISVYSNFLATLPCKLTKAEINISKYLQETIDWFSQYPSDARIFNIPCKLAHIVSARFNGISNQRLQLYYRYIILEGEWGFRYTEEDTGDFAKSSGGWMNSMDVLGITPIRTVEQVWSDPSLDKKKFPILLFRSEYGFYK